MTLFDTPFNMEIRITRFMLFLFPSVFKNNTSSVIEISSGYCAKWKSTSNSTFHILTNTLHIVILYLSICINVNHFRETKATKASNGPICSVFSWKWKKHVTCYSYFHLFLKITWSVLLCFHSFVFLIRSVY